MLPRSTHRLSSWPLTTSLAVLAAVLSVLSSTAAFAADPQSETKTLPLNIVFIIADEPVV